MYDIEFENIKNLDKTIKEVNTKDANNKTLTENIVLFASTSAVIGSVLTFAYTAIPPVTSIAIGLGTGFTSVICSNTYTIIKNAVVNSKRQKAREVLNKVNDTLENNGIYTDEYSIAQGLVFKHTNKTTEEQTNEEGTKTKAEKVNENYYLFLTDTCEKTGILEKTVKTTLNNKENTETTNFYVLEDEDIKQFDNYTELQSQKPKTLTKKLK